MEKIVDAQMIEKELEKINSFLGCRKKVNESRVQKRTFSKRGLFSLWSLDMISGHENYMNEKGEKTHNVGFVKQFLYYAMDLYMSSLTDKSKKSFMEYLNSEEGEKDFDELEHIRGYFLHSNY